MSSASAKNSARCLYDCVGTSSDRFLIRAVDVPDSGVPDSGYGLTYADFHDFARSVIFPQVERHALPIPIQEAERPVSGHINTPPRRKDATDNSTTSASPSSAAFIVQDIYPRRNVGIIFLDNCAAFVTLFLGLLRYPFALCPFSPKLGPANLSDELHDLAHFHLLILDVRLEGSTCSEDGSDVNPEQKQLAQLFRTYAREKAVPILEVSKIDPRTGRFEMSLAQSVDGTPSRGSPPTTTPNFAAMTQLGDVALRLHTSGTTKRAKTVPLTHRNLLEGAAAIRQTLGVTEDDVALNAMPLFHIHGIAVNVLVPVLAGASICPLPVFAPDEFFRVLRAVRPTYYSAVPAIHERLVQFGRSRSASQQQTGITGEVGDNSCCSLRFVRNCSAALLPPVAAELEQLFRCQVVGTYAMTESMPICSNPTLGYVDVVDHLGTAAAGANKTDNNCTIWKMNSRLDPNRRLDSVGRAQGPVVVIRHSEDADPVKDAGLFQSDALVAAYVGERRRKAADFALCDEGLNVPDGEPGEVCVKGPMVTKGYERDQADWRDCVNDYTPDGFLRTGDKGFLDSRDKHLVLLGRYKEIINRGGEKLSPFLVESVLIQHPLVEEVLCFACPHPTYGECVGVMLVEAGGRGRAAESPLQTGGGRGGNDNVFSPAENSEQQLDLPELRRWMRDEHKMGSMYFPEILVFSPLIPRAHTGKPQRIGLAKRLGFTPESVGAAVSASSDGVATLLPDHQRLYSWAGGADEKAMPRPHVLVKKSSTTTTSATASSPNPPAVPGPGHKQANKLTQLQIQDMEDGGGGAGGAAIAGAAPGAANNYSVDNEKSRVFWSVLHRFGLHKDERRVRENLDSVAISLLVDSISVIQMRALFLESFSGLSWPLHLFSQSSLADLLRKLNDDVRILPNREAQETTSPAHSVMSGDSSFHLDHATTAGSDPPGAVTRESRPYVQHGSERRTPSSTPKAAGAAAASSSATASVPLDENAVPPDATTSRIAPTAIVRGKLGAASVVEDYAVIGPDVVLGDRCFVGNFARLQGRIRAGDNNVFYDNVSIGNPPQDFFGAKSARDGEITIGDGCVFREYVSVNMPTIGASSGTTPTGTRIGSGSMVHSHCNIGHDCQLGEKVNLNMNCYLAGFSRVMDGTTLSISCSLHQGVIVGPKCFVGMHVALTADVPPFHAVVRNDQEGVHSGAPRRPGGAEYRIGIDREGLRRKVRAPTLAVDVLENAYRDCSGRGTTNTSKTRGASGSTSRSPCSTSTSEEVLKKAKVPIFHDDLAAYVKARKLRPAQVLRNEYRLNAFHSPDYIAEVDI